MWNRNSQIGRQTLKERMFDLCGVTFLAYARNALNTVRQACMEMLCIGKIAHMSCQVSFMNPLAMNLTGFMSNDACI